METTGDDEGNELKVKQGEPILVPPAEETPRVPYFLSNLDQNVAVIIKTIFCFKSKDEGNERAAKVIKDALAKVLVHYYPLAGRLTISAEGKLMVDCTGEGVLFVEAEADCNMADVGDIDKPESATLDKLIYNVRGAKNIMEMPLLVVQVTNFRCGGFVLGRAMNHCMFDGIAAVEFVKSWSEIAQNLPLSVTPFLDRTILRSRTPPLVEFPHREFLDITDISDTATIYKHHPMLYRSFCFDLERLDRLKRLAIEESFVSKCTSFEALSGFVWQARTRALGLRPKQQTKLLFAIDGRARFNPPLPRSYFGNGMVLANSLATAEELTKNSVGFAVKKVQEANRMVTDSYMRSAIDYFEMTRSRPSLTGTLLLSTWSRLPFHTINFGWEEPVHHGPVTMPEKDVVLFTSHGKERNGIMVMMGLPDSAMAIFEQLVEEI
ncbi:hypothetical protein HPP92_009820 [Vanilla planifolia]|uniref:Omega-hydroxypalmitate O-feruloyl transferase n=1 Tax=Vanilla planifolia TaxID=51239 RepID=A0A835V7C3_VANPL|nr:hypothetical protein HPP92_009820 [Vanilla planifolia]